MEKVCKACDKSLNVSEFGKNSRCADKLNLRCKRCVNKQNKEYRDSNKTKVLAARKEYYFRTLDNQRSQKRKYVEKSKDLKRAYDVEYRRRNSARIAAYKAEWENKNRNNIKLKITKNLRRRMNHVLKGTIKASSTFDLLGCDRDFFMSHLESQFQEGMTWENYGEWHMDHIKACHLFDLTKEEDQMECFHYTNVRPLWKKDNLSRTKESYRTPFL